MDPHTAMHWSELFSSSENFRYPLNLRPGTAAAFYGPTAAVDAILAERRHWIAAAPSGHLGFLAEAEAALSEATAFLMNAGPMEMTGIDLVAHLGRHLEPDFLLLQGPRLHVVAGCVCFPSMWPPEEKFGHPLADVHAPVPGLNDQLGSHLERFFSQLKPGASWERSNWGLSRSAELNQHPSRSLPRLTADVSVEHVWLRVEHQSLLRLPYTGAVLFGIRIENVSLPEILAHAEARRGLAHQLSTMPDPTAAYKGLTASRPALLRLLR